MTAFFQVLANSPTYCPTSRCYLVWGRPTAAPGSETQKNTCPESDGSIVHSLIRFFAIHVNCKLRKYITGNASLSFCCQLEHMKLKVAGPECHCVQWRTCTWQQWRGKCQQSLLRTAVAEDAPCSGFPDLGTFMMSAGISHHVGW